jgi:RimJ/RimL family protein N-acetyltransferase
VPRPAADLRSGRGLEIVAVTMARNLRSRAVMERIGMTSDPAEDFDDPDVGEGPLRRHLVYRKPRDPAIDTDAPD